MGELLKRLEATGLKALGHQSNKGQKETFVLCILIRKGLYELLETKHYEKRLL